MPRRPFAEAYRTTVCKFAASGTCRNGPECRFLHPKKPAQTNNKIWKMVAEYQGEQLYGSEKREAASAAPPASPTPNCCSSCARQYVAKMKQDPRDSKWWQHFRRLYVEEKDDGLLDESAERHFWTVFARLPPAVYTSLTWANELEYDTFLRLGGLKE
jgi:hypothetical protein